MAIERKNNSNQTSISVAYQLCDSIATQNEPSSWNGRKIKLQAASKEFCVQCSSSYSLISESVQLTNTFLKSFDSKSFNYDLGLPDMSRGSIGYINGINTSFDRARDFCLLLSEFGDNVNIEGTYNATHGLLPDSIESGLRLITGTQMSPCSLLREKWDQFFSNADSGELYLHFCHSAGAIITRDALTNYDPQLRKRIIVVNIAGGAYIPLNICQQAYNYVSADIVPEFDVLGKYDPNCLIIRLEPHPDSFDWDHDCDSPTYLKFIKKHIIDYFQLMNIE